jgi:phosphoribosylformylglycinamidine cyclo-ligase
MPGTYTHGQYDVVGCIVGAVDRSRIIDGTTIRPGDIAIGLASSGLHTNGYSLARKVLLQDARLRLQDVPRGCGRTLGAILLEPHRAYAPLLLALMQRVRIRGLAHITGGGLLENIPRILPDAVDVRIDTTAWCVPPIFQLIAARGAVSAQEMFRVFNMGIGMVVIVRPADAARVLAFARRRRMPATVIGDVVNGRRRVLLHGLPT